MAHRLRSRCLALRGAFLLLGVAAFLATPTVCALAEDAPPAAPPKGEGDPKPADPAKPDAPKPGEPGPGAGAGGADPVPPEPVKLADATAELAQLDTYLGKAKSDNQDILASMETLMKAYRGLVPNDEAGKASFESDRTKLQKEIEAQLLKALVAVRIRTNSKANERDDVNVRAAQYLGETHPRVTGKIITALENKIFKAKGYEPATTLYDAAFLAIAKLSDLKEGLPYVQSWLKYDSTPVNVDRIKSAFDAVVAFRGVEGDKRREIVSQILRNFVGTEAAANRGNTKEEQAQKRVWDKVKASVIKALQVYSREPKSADGVSLIATVAEFDKWFRNNDQPRNPAWHDEKAVEK